MAPCSFAVGESEIKLLLASNSGRLLTDIVDMGGLKLEPEEPRLCLLVPLCAQVFNDA